MFFEQILRADIGCAAYLVGSNDAGEAAIVDPRIDMVDELIELAHREGLRIRYVIETHNHADHVAGHHQLTARTGATIALHADAGVAYPHLALRHGDELTLGEVRLRVLHTPGHRPEHIALTITDTSRGDDPWIVLTGDSLFIGDVARPDLAIPGQQGAEALFQSLRDELLALPDGTLAYPAHVAGSLCGRVTNRMTGTTIGFERRYNPALAIPAAERFVQYMNDSLPERPPNLARIVALNMAAAPLDVPTLAALTAEEARRLQDDGAIVLDVRSARQFAAGHIPGAVSIALDGSQFPNRAGLVLPAETPLVLVTGKDADAARALQALLVIGYNHAAGYLAHGMASWTQAGYPTATLAQMSVSDLAARQASDPTLQILDVRELSEWESGHISGASHLPFHKLEARLGELDLARPITTICASGQRSTIAASLLRRRGAANVANVTGGMSAWSAAAYPVVTSEPSLVPARE